MDARWKFDARITKAFKDEQGRMHVKAIASDNLEDKQGDRMSTAAVVSMAKQANSNGTPILPSHHDAFPIGKVFESKAIHKKTRVQFSIDVVLDEDMPQSEKLFKSVKKGKRDFQLSIGGFINLDNEKAIEFEEGKDGHIVRVINDLKLDHIAVTRKDMAANPRTGFRGALIKSLETSLLELKKDGDNKKMAKKEDKKDVNKKDEDDKEIKDEDKKDENENENEEEKDEGDNDEESNVEKLASVVKDMISEFTDIHKSDDGEVTEDQINALKSIHNDIGEFLKEVSPEDEADEDDEDDKEEKADISEKLEALKKNMDSNTVALAKATKGAIEEIGSAVKSLAKTVKGITKNKQKSGRISDDDDNDDEIKKDKGNGVWNGVLFGKNAE